MSRSSLLIVFTVACLFRPATVLAQLDPSQWRIVAVSTENLITGEQARHAIDGDPETQWHTQWLDPRKSPPAEPPHSITLDFRSEQPVNALRYRARAHGEGGLPGNYRLELSRDGTNWTTASTGAFEFRSEWTPHATISLPDPVPARFLRLTVLSLRESRRPTDPGFVMGELDVATPKHSLVPTTMIPVPQSREWNYGGYHWRRRHESVLAYAHEHRPRLVFLGDSITHQWGGPPQSETPKPGESVWNEFYGSRQAMDIGYGWDRVENMLWRVEHGELDDADPRLVVLLAGTNNLEVNTPAEIAQGIERLCEEIHRRKSRARILLLGLFPRGENRRFAALEETNQRLSSLARRHRYLDFRDIGEVFLDVHGQLTRAIMPDLLHLSAEGYRRWAQAIEPMVRSALGEKSTDR